MSWCIQNNSAGKFEKAGQSSDGVFVTTPEDNLIVFRAEELADLMANSLSLLGEDLCGGLSPYGVEASLLDFNISKDNPDHLSALVSAFDDDSNEKSISRDDWINVIKGAAPGNVALMMSVCGAIGWPQIAYDLVVEHGVPPFAFFKHICGISDMEPSDTHLLDSAADNNPVFGGLINSSHQYHDNCVYCINDKETFSEKLCALMTQFQYLCEYARLSKKEFKEVVHRG